MKLHAPIQQAIIESLREIFSDDGRYADKVIEHALRSHRKWGARDRRTYAEITYDIVRWWRLLHHFAMAELSDHKSNAGRANADDTDELETPEQLEDRERTAVLEAILANYQTRRENLRESAKELPLAVRESFPDWLVTLFTKEMGLERASQMLVALNGQAPQILRANELLADREKVEKALLAEEIETVPVHVLPSALRLRERKNVFKTEAFKKGLFEMQDGGSQLIAPFLQPKPGDTIVDACAGAGGKTLHLAALTKNKGRIYALDIHQRKLDELKLRARRAQVSNVETRLIDSTKTIKRLEGKVDRLLLDVPCSGLGVVRRSPDTKWKLTSDELTRLAKLQLEILEQYSKLLKPGAVMVYATCSVLPSENMGRVKEFLATKAGSEFTVEESWQVSPIETEYDGFFACRLLRAK